ncbi:unnamed protein product [Oppiella nova]|uniref:Uncharacterized protein n=1 Tax=Oppiella nova TaxID=334625 RepID=A0A7R9LZX6_9ACAR|nr:unnamed protein product [Oppiella nova]CAG2168575.1 unnamed protein product [Oppiella nova]
MDRKWTIHTRALEVERPPIYTLLRLNPMITMLFTNVRPLTMSRLNLKVANFTCIYLILSLPNR